MFKIPDAPARRRTVRDFEARSAILVNASNIAIFSWGAGNPTPLPRDTTVYSRSRCFRQPTPLFLPCSRVYLRDRIRKQMAAPFFYLFLKLLLSFSPSLSFSLFLFRSVRFLVYLHLESDGNTDRIRVICGDILTRSEYGVTSLFSPSFPRRFILDWIFGCERSVQSRLHNLVVDNDGNQVCVRYN